MARAEEDMSAIALSPAIRLLSFIFRSSTAATTTTGIVKARGDTESTLAMARAPKPTWDSPSPIIENRLSQVTFSALGQKAGTEAKYAWDPDCKKREIICKRCKELAPEFDYEIGGTTSINAVTPGMNKEFGMTHLLDELKVDKSEVLYFGDMTQPGGNDYPVVQMGIDTITVRSHEDTAYALRGILSVTE